MALAIIETKVKAAWSTKKSISLAIISLIIGTVIFSLAYIGMSQHTGMGSYNQTILSWIVSHRETQITTVMKAITTIASPIVFAVVICIGSGIWAIANREIWRPLLLVVATGIAAVISTLIKIVTMNGRPPKIDMILPFETDYSFPSGHTIGVVVCILVLGYLICSRRSSTARIFGWTIATIIFTGCIAISRIYLGYHWLTDVVASIGLGFIILALIIVVDRFVVKRLNN